MHGREETLMILIGGVLLCVSCMLMTERILTDGEHGACAVSLQTWTCTISLRGITVTTAHLTLVTESWSTAQEETTATCTHGVIQARRHRRGGDHSHLTAATTCRTKQHSPLSNFQIPD